MDEFRLGRFVEAQEPVFHTALAELRAGCKKSHWMWFVFPQVAGLGRSPAAQYYAITSLEEARAYLAHPVLGPRLRQCVEALLRWAGDRSAEQILGSIDALKLKSSLTLFDQVQPADVFDRGLAAFCCAERDQRTLAILEAAR